MKRFHSMAAGHLLLLVASLICLHDDAVAQSIERDRATADKLYNDGNWKDAYDIFHKICLNKDNSERKVAQDLVKAVQCLNYLGRQKEFDALLENTVEAHSKKWRVLQAVANQYLVANQHQHYGYIISGKFERGEHRGGGRVANSLERDRIRALQLLTMAMPLANKDENKSEVASFYMSVANNLLYNRGYYEAWRLQYKSKLDELPDYDDGYPYFRNWSGAPVDANGEPIYHAIGGSWDGAQTDGERWRWCLVQALEFDPNRRNQIRWQLAQFGQQQFGVQTMQHYGYGRHFAGRADVDDGTEDESGTYDLHTLKENETIARLATGIKRFELPDDYNFIKIYQAIAVDPKTGNGENSLNALANVFLNRRQYVTAADYWRKSMDAYGNASWKQEQLKQIVGNWGAFEATSTQPADQGATVEYRFRNGKSVRFTAHEIKVSQLLDDVKAYLKSDPQKLNWQQAQISNIGWRLINDAKRNEKYIGDQVATWKLDLKPRKNHYDRRITVTTPLQKSGAYLLTAKMNDGNTCKIILWVSDTAIVKKQLPNRALYFVCDAATGKPIERANLEFFGWYQKHIRGNQYQIVTANFAEVTDKDGQIQPDPRDLQSGNYQWLITARDKKGRFAFHGFSHVWYGQRHDPEYNQTKSFVITDRPVYRPGQKVHFKAWVRHAQYDKDDVSQYANKSISVWLDDPKGNRALSVTKKADQFGGIVGEYEIPADATLGQYHVGTNWGGVHFRVEEYKKPEFEVSIEAPTEPVMLGEKITATINAKYYFGSPVTKATVKYKIVRNDHSNDWYPYMHWDWCYGPGYWWFCYDYPWYPGWSEWVGCMRPIPWWWGYHNPNPPEVVAEREVEIGEDGVVEVEIDTALAKELHGNKNHKYTITAEVRDESRRTIVGTGDVLVARKPFKVFTWVDQGYYRVGDVIRADFKAQTLDKKPVGGSGLLTLYKVTYGKKNQPVETAVRRWDVETNVEGTAFQQIIASAKGQYRLSYDLTDKKGHTVEGGYLFTIIGDGFNGADYRFNRIELIPDQRSYAPGDKVRLQINTEQVDSTVLLFVRPTNGVYLPPKTIRIKGKSTVEQIAIVKKDMPNFFVEAVTVSGSKVHADTKEIVVPPEKRVLNVAVSPSEEAYKPGQKAKVKIRLTDHQGENYSGSTVVAIYDKSVEYISGGSNIGDIKEYFWKWRRHHNPSQETSLTRWFGNLVPNGQTAMGYLGVFGASVAEEFDNFTDDDGAEDASVANTADFAPANQSKSVMRQSAAAPQPSVAMQGGGMGGFQQEASRDEKQAGYNTSHASGAAAELVEPEVRSNFADTALWVGSLMTDKNGEAEVELEMPENLTTWKIKVWGMGHGTRVGAGETEVVTRKDLIIRLQAPRFFVQKDEVVLSANVHNYLKEEKEVTVSIELPDELLVTMDGVRPTVKVKVPADGETRVDWRVKVLDEGQATVRMKALTDEESDAMEMKFPCYIHGMLKMEAWAGTVRPEDESAKVTISVPAERRVDDSVLEIRYSPTLAAAMIDALPYLADYPYGCTEQTLNRFLPTAITQKTLLNMNLDLKTIKEKRTNLNAQEIGDDRERAKQWNKYNNAVFDEKELERMVKKGVQRLTDMQLSDGGWGWFSGYGEQSWPHTTAVVVHGLQIAKENDVPLVPGMLDRGIQWLKRYQEKQTAMIRNAPDRTDPWKSSADNIDALVHMILIDAGIDNEEMRGYLYRDRNNLAVYSKAMFGLALYKVDDQEKLDMIMKNIEQFLIQDEENETAYLQLPGDQYWWYWYGSETEANAYYLKLLARTDPDGQRAPRLVKYLLNNRKHATYWRSTRDTAVCVEAFADYIRATGEDKPDMFVEIWMDGEKKKEVEITAENLFDFDNKFVLTGKDVADGEHTIEIRRRGGGPVYFNSYLTNFTLEDMITKAGLEIKVTRKFYKLERVDKEVPVSGSRGQVINQKVEKYERKPIANLATLKSGDLVEVELSIESKNDYEYILFEDMKAAGFESVEVRSGYNGNDMGAYAEFRDNRVSFFVRRLARGNHSISYRLRAEIPGKFSALPAKAYAMYAPELKGNSDEMKLKIED